MTRISWEGACSFNVPFRFACYVYCTARSSWLDVGPVLEMNRTLQCSVQRWQCPIHNCILKSFVYELNIRVYNFTKWLLFDCGFSSKVTCAFRLQKDTSKLTELDTFKPKKRQYLSHYWSDKGFKGTVVKRALKAVQKRVTLFFLNSY